MNNNDLGLKKLKPYDKENGYLLTSASYSSKQNHHQILQKAPHYSQYTPFSRKIKPILSPHITVLMDSKPT